MSIYTTPLQFAYFTALLFSILLSLRGWREERLSDRLLALVLLFLAIEIQDYTFGFAGINFLWEELNGFPRHTTLAFAPTIYLYLLSQVNRDFKLEKKHLLFYIPYFSYFFISIIIFLNGAALVKEIQLSKWDSWFRWLEEICIYTLYFYFFRKALIVYHDYKQWIITHFSDVDSVSFKWLRNFIYLIIAGESIRLLWNIADYIIDMPYEQDWWWHLFIIVVICHVSISGYSQIQYNHLHFEPMVVTEKKEEVRVEKQGKDFSHLIPKIERQFYEELVYLDPELTLSQLAIKIKTNSTLLSAAINQTYEKNFNDFVNEFRIKAFEEQLKNPKNASFTRLSIALDCGFNSKATFNRALKKFGRNGLADEA